MKRILVLAILICLVLPAYAQVDPYETLTQLKTVLKTVEKMIRVVDLWNDGQVEVEDEVMVFDDTFKTQLKDKYLSLLDDLETQVIDLPGGN